MTCKTWLEGGSGNSNIKKKSQRRGGPRGAGINKNRGDKLEPGGLSKERDPCKHHRDLETLKMLDDKSYFTLAYRTNEDKHMPSVCAGCSVQFVD